MADSPASVTTSGGMPNLNATYYGSQAALGNGTKKRRRGSRTKKVRRGKRGAVQKPRSSNGGS